MKRIKDKNLRYLYNQNEYLIISIKFLLNNIELKRNKNFINYIYNKNNKIFKFLYKNTLTKIRTYCIISNRSRGILKDFKISRIFLKNYGSKGIINGLYKSSW